MGFWYPSNMEATQMTIPETATKVGGISGFIPSCLTQAQYDRIEAVMAQWQAADNEKHYVTSGFTHPNDQVHGHCGAKYMRLDIGGSGAFMVHIVFGFIYGIKGYGKVDKNKVSGNIYDPNFDAAVLVRDRFRYGRFENNSDGSLRQHIVRR
jgi:hypothetical protein